jgi:hypothetical protein
MKGLSLLDEVLLVLLLLLRVLYATIDKGPTCCRVNEGSSNVFLADREQLSVCTGHSRRLPWCQTLATSAHDLCTAAQTDRLAVDNDGA